ncbi:MAG TPA: histidinol dehydrogenase [Planctomycetes bacterium]|nr:histidinol dehydrogenase [Planctomycetota bacterium]HIJ69993.1 histidinol dehydrogenase [Planctomycetota bacterium]
MSRRFDQILISHKQTDFVKRLRDLRFAIVHATRFKLYSKDHQALQRIMQDVFEKKDAALAEYTSKFDGVLLKPEQFRVDVSELEKAHKQIDQALLASARRAIDNVREYQEKIFIGKSISGKVKYTPIKRVGICVPGASAPLPSTVIMTAVPAQVAGVEEIVVVSPPRYNGTIHPVILAICHELGIKEVYRIGGAQAVAALAQGTDTIKKVYKIVGPGNRWVSMAKREVLGLVDIDSVAGPSEVLIIADDRANPAFLAADMLSQAEHDPGSAILFTDSENLAEKVCYELEKQVAQLDRAEGTARCLKEFSGIFIFENLDDAAFWADDFAAEHLQIQCGKKSREIADKIENAGAIFIGAYSPVAVGDYWAGPSHTLPTGMTAKFFSALSANDFVKSTSIIEYSREQLEAGSDDIIRLAMVEGLDAHAKSVQIRCEK